MQENRGIFLSIIISLSVLLIFFSIHFLIYYPLMAGVIFNFHGDNNSNETNFRAWMFVLFYWSVFLIILISFVFIFNIAIEIKNNNLYSQKVLKLNYTSICLFLFNIIVLIIGNIILKIIHFGTVYYIDFMILFFDACLILLQLFFANIVKNKLNNGKFSNKKEILFFRIGIIIFSILIIFIIALYHPYSLNFLINNEYLSQKLNMDSVILFIIPYIFLSLTTIPILVILFMFWKITIHIKNDNLFSNNVLNFIHKSILILSITLIIYIIGNYYFYNTSWVTLSMHYYQFSIVFAVMIFMLHIIKVIIKKEVLLNSIETQKKDS